MFSSVQLRLERHMQGRPGLFVRIHSFDAEKHKYPTVQVTETHGGT